MAATYSEALREALFSDEQRESVDRIKDAVTDALRETDRTAKIVRTSHFNNTYSPDLVMEWPGQPQKPRRVFLRPTQQSEVLADDVAIVGSEDTIFLQLDELVENQQAADALLSESALEHDSLVTRVESLERFVSRRAENAGAGLMAASLVRAGRGLLEVERAERTASVIAEGFVGAQRVDDATTAQAVREIDGLLQPTESRRLNNVLQTVWVASGGQALTFPSEVPDLSSALSNDALDYLLNFDDVEDEEFWLRLARGVDLAALGSLGMRGPTPALQRLVSAALPMLRGKACHVRAVEAQFADEQDHFEWLINEGALALQGFGLRAWVSPRLKDVAIKRAEAEEPTVPALVRRSADSGVSIVDFEATNGLRVLRYGSANTDDVASDEGVSVIPNALGDDTVVRRAATRFRSRYFFEVRFAAMTASGRVRARPPVAEVLWVAFNLLTDLSPRARRELRAVLHLDDPTVEDQVEPHSDPFAELGLNDD